MQVKRTRDNEPIWTALGMEADASGKYQNVGYCMVVNGSRWDYRTTAGRLEIRKAAKGGWDVVLFGDVVDHHQLKTEAKWAAMSLLD